MPNQFDTNRFLSETHKECACCKQIKEHKDFHKHLSNKKGGYLTHYCKVCACEKSRRNHLERKQRDPLFFVKNKNRYTQNKYGITLEEYTKKLIAQNNTCAICGVKLSADDPNTHLDHCHKTGKLRAFLCTNCNRGLGHFQDNVSNLEKAIEYLNAHTSNVD